MGFNSNMSQNLFNTPLSVPITPSVRLIMTGSFIALLAMASVLYTGLSIVEKGMLLITLLAMIGLEYRKQQKSRHWCALQYDNSGNWWLVNHAGEKQALTLGSGCYSSMYLAVIHGACFEEKLILWLWRYQYPPQTFRRLSLYLRGSIVESPFAKNIDRHQARLKGSQVEDSVRCQSAQPRQPWG